MKILARSLGLVAALVAAAAFAQSPAISSPEARAILEELRAIRALLERQQQAAPRPPAPAPEVPQGPVSLKLDGAYVLGRPDAPVTMVEFSDYECPFCRQFHMASFEQLKRDYIDTGKLRYVSRDLPLGFHANAKPAAKAARCAGEQGRFWEMRKALIVNGNALTPELYGRLGRELRLDERTYQECLAGDRHDKAIADQVAQANGLGISGTPTFVVGRSNGDSVDGQRIVGAQPLATFEARIKELLAAK